MRDRFPDALFLGEVIHDDYAEFVKESTVDSVTQYELWKAIWSSLLDRNLFELQWTLGRNNELLDTFVPNTFVGNHDVTRIATTEVTAIENERMTYRTIERGGRTVDRGPHRPGWDTDGHDQRIGRLDAVAGAELRLWQPRLGLFYRFRAVASRGCPD